MSVILNVKLKYTGRAETLSPECCYFNILTIFIPIIETLQTLRRARPASANFFMRMNGLEKLQGLFNKLQGRLDKSHIKQQINVHKGHIR